MSEAPPWLRHARRRTGLLILVALTLFVAAVLQAGVLRDLLRSTLTLRVILPESGVAGLNAGAAVEVLGTAAGTVRRIMIDPDANFHAVVEIDPTLEPFLRRDSKVFIRKQFGIAGAAYLEITRGTGEPLDWEYAVLTAESDQAQGENVGAIIEEVRGKVMPLIDDVQRIVRSAGDLVASLQANDSPLQQGLANLATVTGRLAHGQGSVGRLLADDSLARDLSAMIQGLNRQVAALDAILPDVRAATTNIATTTGTISGESDKLPRMLDSTAATLASVRRITANVDRTMPEVADLMREASRASVALPTVLAQSQQTLAELQQLLVQLQGVWLLGGGGGADAQARDRPRLSPLEARP